MSAPLHSAHKDTTSIDPVRCAAGAAMRSPALWLLIGGYSLYAAIFIFQTSYVIDSVRYFALYDDEMISMRFAKHLAEGYGLVWNAGGPRVEGYTNPLWTTYMALFHRLPIPPPKISLAIQISGAVCAAWTVALAWRLARRLAGGSSSAAFTAALLTAFYVPLNRWALQGFEVAPLALVVTWAAARAIDALDREAFDPVVYVLLGTATLLRPDGVVPYVAVLGFLLYADPARRRDHLLIGGSILAACAAGQTLFRFWYFGDPLPNTYYLKMTGYPAALRLGRGAIVLALFVYRVNVLAFVAAFAVLLWRRQRAAWLLGSIAAAMIAYSVYVGGDAWEEFGGSNRYISVAMPAFFVLLATALHDLCARLFGRPLDSSRLARAAFTALAVVVLVDINVLIGRSSLAELLLRGSHMHVQVNALMTRLARRLDTLTDRRVTLGVFWAGTLPYFLDRTAVDMLGKSDAVVAREPMHATRGPGESRWTAFEPGHMKWDFAYSIGSLEPDVIPTLGWVNPRDAVPYLRDRYALWESGDFSAYLRLGSPHIIWAEVQRSGTLTTVR